MHKNGKISKESGQSLVEVLIAVAIGGLIIGSSVIAITLSLRSNVQNEAIKNATFLLNETIDKTRSIAQGDWSKLYNVTKATPTYIASDGGESIFVNGTEGVLEEDLSTGLVGHWQLDETSGTDAYDSSGNDNKGTLMNDPAQAGVENCYAGGCLDFDGGNDWVDVGNLGNPGSGTISLWFYKDNINVQYLLDGRGTGNWWFLTHYNGFDVNFLNRVTYNGTSINTWYHVAVTADASETKMYINGELVSTGSGLSIDFSSVRMATRYTNSAYLSGKLDDVRIYNRVLSADEVAQLKNSRVYNRSFSVENVNRNSTTGAIMESGGSEDPSTQKVTGTITWPNGSTITTTEFMTRARNEIERETDWSGPSGYSEVNPEGTIDTSTPGEIKLIVE